MRAAATLTLLCALGPATALGARPDTPNTTAMYHFDAGDTVLTFDSAGGRFRVHYTTTGTNMVPAGDADGSGTPDSVEEVAALYEDVLTFYEGLGFRAPRADTNVPIDNGGDGRFDVYLVDFALKADGQFVQEDCDSDGTCSGYMVQENDFAGYGYPSRTYANRVLASHEFFHAVQAAYDVNETAIFSEGTATWATEQFDATLSDLESQAKGYLDRPDHSLNVPLPGPVDAFSYGTGIFFEFLSEKLTPAVVRELWEAAVGAPEWFDRIDDVLLSHGSSFADAFASFAEWNLFTKTRANPARSYKNGAKYALVKTEAQAAPVSIAAYRVFPAATGYLAVPAGGRAAMQVALVPGTADLSPLRLIVAVRRGEALDPVTTHAATDRPELDVTGADELLVGIVNTARTGESLRPGVCVGTADEVSACRTTLGDTVDPTPIAPAPTGGCTMSAPSRGTPPWGAVASLMVLLAALGACGRRGRSAIFASPSTHGARQSEH